MTIRSVEQCLSVLSERLSDLSNFLPEGKQRDITEYFSIFQNTIPITVLCLIILGTFRMLMI